MTELENKITIQDFQLYEIQVSGIRCTNCSKKIVDNIKQNLVKSISVNVLSEKIIVSLDENQKIENVIEKLQKLGFQITQRPYLINQRNNQERQIYFNYKYNSDYFDSFLLDLKQKAGILKIQKEDLINDQKKSTLISISYNPLLIKAREINNSLENFQEECSLEVFNPHLECFKKKVQSVKNVSFKTLVFSILIVIFFMLFSLVIYKIDYLQEFQIYPYNFGIFSIYFIILFTITVIVLYFFGLPVFKSAWLNFYKFRALNMETLISLGSFSAFLMLIYLMIVYTIQNLQNDKNLDKNKLLESRLKQISQLQMMMETSTMILCIVNIGKFLEGKAKSLIVKAMEEIFPENNLVDNQYVTYIEPKNRKFQIDSEKQYEVSLIDKEDIVRIFFPMKLLVDGVILFVEEDNPLEVIDSLCYGQDDIFRPKAGQRIKSGSEIKSGVGYLQVENTVEQCMLSKISNQLNLAQNENEQNESGLTAIFSTLSKYFVISVIIISFITLVTWIILIVTDIYVIHTYLNNQILTQIHTYIHTYREHFCVYCIPFERAISILVVSCPCVLGLAIPTVFVITLNLAMKNQILIKKNNIFEKIHQIKCVVFDKTGTLFTKIEEIKDYVFIDHSNQITNNLQFTENEIWELISILEKESKHPLGELLYRESLQRNKTFIRQYFYQIGDIQTTKIGLKAKLQKIKSKENIVTFIGNYQMMVQNGVLVDDQILKIAEQSSLQGITCLYLAVENQVIFLIKLDNTNNLRPESYAVVQYLQKHLKKKVYILSGDSQKTVEKVGEYLDIPQDQLLGEIDAEKKKNVIFQIKKENKSEVMMIGDGLNDILSLQEATVGVSINAKSELNLLASDMVALNENLWKIASMFQLLSKARLFIIINLIWAFCYNVIMIPISAGVLIPFGFEISPVVASISMSVSSVIVVIFSNFMRFLQYDPSQTKIWKNFPSKPTITDKISRQQEQQKKRQKNTNNEILIEEITNKQNFGEIYIQDDNSFHVQK